LEEVGVEFFVGDVGKEEEDADGLVGDDEGIVEERVVGVGELEG
jgi:hypothetical protein